MFSGCKMLFDTGYFFEILFQIVFYDFANRFSE